MENLTDNLARQRELTKLLAEAARAYYGENRELMPNIEYDKLYDELAELEKESGVVLTGSPTAQVGYETATELKKQAHPAPMLSLNKTKNEQELLAWLEDKTAILSYKLDGLTVALTYKDGELFSAVTRGNGLVGEIVTHNAKTFINLPHSIPFKGELSLRGEAAITYSDFKKVNEETGADAAFKNPRNLASGSVRQLDSSVTASRRVGFFAFALVSAESISHKTRAEQFDFLKEQGFETVEWTLTDSNKLQRDIAAFTERAKSENGGFDLPVDGLVLEYDDLSYSASLGATAKFPRDAIAFKWADEQAETTLIDVEWNASRTGLINPIAIFEPVELEGTTVSRASVHNVSIVEELALGIGDRILVYKANMIIPQISENLTRSGTLSPPETCPVCGTPTEIKEENLAKTLNCTNPACPARHLKSFSHFVSRPALNIEGLSEQTLEKFIAAGFLHELADIFRLEERRGQITTMDGFGEKSFGNLISAIETARTTTCARLLVGLGLPEIGVATAKEIARAFGYDWRRIMNADFDELSTVEGVGGTIAQGFVDWFANPQNRQLTEKILAKINFEQESAPASGGALEGLTFVITGSLENYENRDALKEKIEKLGGKTASSVSAKTDYLINNDDTSLSSKNKKAKELGVKIITEKAFEELCETSF